MPATVYLLTPLDIDAENWIDENLGDALTWFCGGVAVEHRYIEDIYQGIVNDGLKESFSIHS